MSEDGPRGRDSDGTEAASATRVGRAECTDPDEPGTDPGPAGSPGTDPDSAGSAPERRTLRRTGGTLPRPNRPDRIAGTRRPYRAPWLIALLVFAVYTTISLFRYLQLNPLSWDLGIFTELVKQYAHLHAPVADLRGAGVNLFGDHFSPIIALIAPFFLIWPSPITLLVAQALLTAVSVLPVTWAAADKLGRRAGGAVGAAYGFSWGLQQMINFDFHEIAFAVPLLAFSLSALVRGRRWAAMAWALPLVFVKEDQGFTVAAIGVLIIISQWRNEPERGESGWGAVFGGELLIVWGVVWSVLAITVIIPHFNAAHHYQYWSDGGTFSPGGHFSVSGTARQFLTSWPVKLQTTLMLLLPTAFVALRSPLALIALPSIVLRFLGTSSNFWGTQWHYNATVMPILFIAAVDAIARIRSRQVRSASSDPAAAGSGPAADGPAADGPGADGPGTDSPGADGPAPGGTGWREPLNAAISRHGAVAMLAIAVALVFQFPVAVLWQPATYQLGAHQADANAAMAKVPDGATVTTTLDLLAPLAARTDTFWIGNPGNPNTAYIVFDGTDSGYSPEPANVPAFVASQHPGATYNVIYDTGDVYVFRRSGP
jgi:uncharacterized membrane protein